MTWAFSAAAAAACFAGSSVSAETWLAGRLVRAELVKSGGTVSRMCCPLLWVAWPARRDESRAAPRPPRPACRSPGLREQTLVWGLSRPLIWNSSQWGFLERSIKILGQTFSLGAPMCGFENEALSSFELSRGLGLLLSGLGGRGHGSAFLSGCFLSGAG